MVIVKVEAEVRPTEDENKVKQAILNVFIPEHVEIEVRGKSKVIVAKAYSLKSLTKLHRLLRAERILDAARSVFKKSAHERSIIFYLNKQAAFRGRLSFTEAYGESPLGPITFIIEDVDVERLIDWLAPKTARGKPLWEMEMPKD